MCSSAPTPPGEMRKGQAIHAACAKGIVGRARQGLAQLDFFGQDHFGLPRGEEQVDAVQVLAIVEQQFDDPLQGNEFAREAVGSWGRRIRGASQRVPRSGSARSSTMPLSTVPRPSAYQRRLRKALPGASAHSQP